MSSEGATGARLLLPALVIGSGSGGSGIPTGANGGAPQREHPPCNTLYMGGLADNIDEMELQVLFMCAGGVLPARRRDSALPGRGGGGIAGGGKPPLSRALRSQP